MLIFVLNLFNSSGLIKSGQACFRDVSVDSFARQHTVAVETFDVPDTVQPRLVTEWPLQIFRLIVNILYDVHIISMSPGVFDNLVVGKEYNHTFC